MRDTEILMGNHDQANWYDKYYPRKFADLVQSPGARPICDIILEEETGRYGRGWLVSGMIGTGKTTLRRA